MLFFYFNVILYMDKEIGKCLLKGVVSMPTVQLTPNQSVALGNFTNEFEVINALADRNRQRIIVLLCENLKDGLTVTEITDRIDHQGKIWCCPAFFWRNFFGRKVLCSCIRQKDRHF